MYLTRVNVDLTNREAARLLASPYRVHAAVQASCVIGGVEEDEDCRVLWRLDDGPTPNSVRLYIVSPDTPVAEELASRMGIPDPVSIESKDYLPFVSRLQTGGVWRFRLKANPVRKVRIDKGRRENPDVVGTLQGHVTVEQQLEWLNRRTAANGFSLLEGETGVSTLVSHRRRETFKRRDGQVTLQTAQFDGLLRVEDVEAFRSVLGFGIGRAKGFGCGLLTLAAV